MSSLCNKNIRRALDISRELMVLADEGEAEADDTGCMVLYGVLRDCAYKIRAEAEREKKAHLAAGIWLKAHEASVNHALAD